ncbi:MAG: hypothetical protein ACRENG_02070 [bacterium]
MKRWLAGGLAYLSAATVVYGQNFYGLSHTALEMSASQYADHLGDQPITRGQTEGTKWRLAHRLQGGWEYDSNIYETSAQRTVSGSARFLLSTRGDRRNERWQVNYAYAAALQNYPRYGDENKLSHDLGGQVAVRLWRWLQLSSKVNATLKLYLENTADYATTLGNLMASINLPHKILADLSLETGQLDYAKTGIYNFDFTFRGAELTLRRTLTTNSTLETMLNRRVVRYERQARAYGPNQQLEDKAELQRDVLTTFRTAMTYGRKLVTQVAVEAQINRSNSFGYDFTRFRASGLLGFRPAKNWLLRAAGTLQHKRYRDDLARLNIRDLDTEREQSNFLVVDISRDFSVEISLIARATVYNNESTVPGVFYRKMLYFTGLEIRL